MRSLVANTFLTLDGVMQASGGPARRQSSRAAAGLPPNGAAGLVDEFQSLPHVRTRHLERIG